MGNEPSKIPVEINPTDECSGRNITWHYLRYRGLPRPYSECPNAVEVLTSKNCLAGECAPVNDMEWDQYTWGDWDGLGDPGQETVNTRIIVYEYEVEEGELGNDRVELQSIPSTEYGNYTLNSTTATDLNHYTGSATDETPRKPSPIKFLRPDDSSTRNGSNHYEQMISERSSRRHYRLDDQKTKIGLIVPVVLIVMMALFFLVWKRGAGKSKVFRGYRSAKNQNVGLWDPRAEEGLLADNREGVVGQGWGESESESESESKD